MDEIQLLDRFHRVLVDEIRAKRPQSLRSPFTVAEIYQDLVPYRTHRDRIGVEMNGDYEHLLLRLLAGEGGYLILESEVARRELRSELEASNPNTGVFRDFAAADVRLNPERLDAEAPARPDAVPWAPEPETPPEPGDDAEDTVPVESLAPSRTAPDEESPEPMDEPMEFQATPGPDEPDAPVEAAAPAATSATEDDEVACRWCRQELPRRDNLNYCPFCGTDVRVVPCPSCGEELEPEWRFCIACGAEVEAA